MKRIPLQFLAIKEKTPAHAWAIIGSRENLPISFNCGIQRRKSLQRPENTNLFSSFSPFLMSCIKRRSTLLGGYCSEFYFSTPNRYIVFVLYTSPGLNTVDGNSG